MAKRYADQDILLMLRSIDFRLHSDAIEYLHKTHETMIIRYVTLNSGSYEDGEELLNDVVLTFFKNARNPAFELNAKISTYFYAVARRKWLKELSKRKSWPKTEIEPDELSLGDESEHTNYENRDHVQRLLEALEPGCQKLLRAFIDGWAMEDIAVMVGLKNADSAKAQKYNCLKKLGKLINPAL